MHNSTGVSQHFMRTKSAAALSQLSRCPDFTADCQSTQPARGTWPEGLLCRKGVVCCALAGKGHKRMRSSQLGVEVAGQAMAQGLRQEVAREGEADAAGVVWVGVLSGMMEAEDGLRRAQGREAVHLDHVGRLTVLQIIVALQIGRLALAARPCENEAVQAARPQACKRPSLHR